MLANCEYICDVGGIYDPSQKLFDHHQATYSGPLSSAGMILRYLLETQKISQGVFDLFSDSLVFGVDEHDNGKSPYLPGYCTFSHVIANFNPIDHSATKEEIEKAFF